MVSVLALSAEDIGIEAMSIHTHDYKIGICCFSDKHTTLRYKKLVLLIPTKHVVLVH